MQQSKAILAPDEIFQSFKQTSNNIKKKYFIKKKMSRDKTFSGSQISVRKI